MNADLVSAAEGAVNLLTDYYNRFGAPDDPDVEVTDVINNLMDAIKVEEQPPIDANLIEAVKITTQMQIAHWTLLHASDTTNSAEIRELANKAMHALDQMVDIARGGQ